jgi:hypothetical protein
MRVGHNFWVLGFVRNPGVGRVVIDMFVMELD